MSWYTENFDGAEEVARAKEERKKTGYVRRVWIKPNSSLKMTFLDDRAFSWLEHQVKINGDWKNWFSCRGRPNGCENCASGSMPYRATAFSVIDHSEWKDRKGNIHKDEKRLYVIKEETAVIFKQKKQRWGGLKGKTVIVSRKGDKDAASGSDFELAMNAGQLESFDLSKLKPEERESYNYIEMFKPLSSEELKTAIASASRGEAVPLEYDGKGGSDSPAAQMGAEDIPF